MTQGSSVRVWVARLVVLGAVQEAVEAWVKTWLLGKFRSPYLCRVTVTDGRWCIVPSLTQATARLVPAWMCQYDPWCGEKVYFDTTPPLITRFTVIFISLLVSLLVVWAPRLLTYRPSKPLLVWARHHTPRRVLFLVAISAILQLTLDHWLFAFLLPPHLLLSHLTSMLSFTVSQLLITVALVRQVRQPVKTLYTSPLVHLHHIAVPSNTPGMTSVDKEPWEAIASHLKTSQYSPQTT